MKSGCTLGDTLTSLWFIGVVAAKHSHHVALTGPLKLYVEGRVKAGDYASVSEVVRTALRLLIEHDEARAVRIAAASANPEESP